MQFYVKTSQETSKKDWYTDGLEKDSFFFYLLQYKEHDDLIKFGYKFSQEKFRECYAKFNHYRPHKSYIWTVNKEAFLNSKKHFGSWYEIWLLQGFVLSTEQKIHKNLKQQLKLTVFPRTREVYKTDSISPILDLVKASLKEFTKEKFQDYSDTKMKTDNEWTSKFADIPKRRHCRSKKTLARFKETPSGTR